ncbi:unnamed protein product [Sphenostylis stenocarpa]|uniref:Uncharacterized protein n=1 Tax=Sphenostylis stenocarpa TaxID=92480 RepID=A0AA86VEW9_9FABA|nr:unnamed protein product [Sphenostylis stenocarpa]
MMGSRGESLRGWGATAMQLGQSWCGGGEYSRSRDYLDPREHEFATVREQTAEAAGDLGSRLPGVLVTMASGGAGRRLAAAARRGDEARWMRLSSE